MKRFSVSTLALIGVLTLSTILWSTGSAQEPLGKVPRERITLTTGELFEVMVVSDIPDARAGWVLTKERRFIEASREAVFRTRLIEPGLYLLDASLATPDGTRTWRRTIDLDLRPVGAGYPPGGASEDVIIATDPPLEGGRLYLDPQRQFVKIWKARPNIRSLDLDLDAHEDRNGDGDPRNDVDNAQTYFRSDGFPLYMWVISDRPERPLRATATLSDGSALTQEFRIVRVDRIDRPYEITVSPREAGLVDFSVLFRRGIPEAPLLFRWDFGDGAQSLLDRPAHTYATNGRYAVSVRVHDLTTGGVVLELEREVNVTSAVKEEIEGIQEREEKEEEPKEAARGSSLLGLLFRLLLVLGISIALGFGGVFLWKRFKKRAAKIEPLEKEPQKAAPALTSEAPKPLELKRGPKEEAPKKPEAKEKAGIAPTEPRRDKEQTKVPPPPPPPPKEQVVPPWLQPSPQPAQPPQPPPPPSPPPPSAAPQPPPPPQLPVSDEDETLGFIRAEGVEEQEEKKPKQPEKKEDGGKTA